jgi:hypothetical protein
MTKRRVSTSQSCAARYGEAAELSNGRIMLKGEQHSASATSYSTNRSGIESAVSGIKKEDLRITK